MTDRFVAKPVFRLLRYFSLSSLALVLVAATLLSLGYRWAAQRALVRSAEANNVLATQIASNALLDHYRPMLADAAPATPEALRGDPRNAAFHTRVLAFMRDTTMLKLKVYAPSGITMYSSEARQIGEDKRANPGFLAAMGGHAASELTHRNTFSAFEGVVESRDVVSSYVPVRDADGRVVAVVELYDDVTALLRHIHDTQAAMFAVVAIVLLPLYLGLVALVKRADSVIRQQHDELTHSADALHDANEGLEARVQARTAELVAAIDAAKRADAAKSQFLSTMSHEIRTPLNGVLGMAELLRDTRLDAEQSRYTGAILAAGRSLHELLSDVLDLAKIEENRVVIERVDFAPAAVLDELATVYTELASARGNRLETDVDALKGLIVAGDPMRLRQVLVNLLGNAIKFTEGGRITVSAQRIDAPAGDARSWLRFGVRDSGVGISPDALQRLFQRFEQADSSTTRRYGGSGLGLVICRRLVELMGGSIQVDSEPGRGSHFQVDLPFEPASGAVPTGPMPLAVVRSAPGARVLVAEDNAINQQVVTALLRRLGAQVQLVSDGVQAVQACRDGRFDLLLLDCQMPEMDGYEAAKQIRAMQAQGSRVPIVALTANASAEDRERCLAAGMDDYLTKPITSAKLTEVVSRYIANAQREADVALLDPTDRGG